MNQSTGFRTRQLTVAELPMEYGVLDMVSIVVAVPGCMVVVHGSTVVVHGSTVVEAPEGIEML
ncbi:hypothetical protein J7438_22545 [Thalassotalea sp. G20_0]|uniref:hypothetical protein n=1 Tax=Thalassotalea sp. G20_0 TaxID=2821093 RepID=UPI001ADD188C|nr:hypothetical protein [Thalassotalea sp. G20_0]MBO9496843.1 hypothetical protein [Thalassotalea sp. G20_0]